MTGRPTEERVRYVPDSPNVGDAPSAAHAADEDYLQDRTRSDEIAADVAVGDELSGYEKVAGRGVPKI